MDGIIEHSRDDATNLSHLEEYLKTVPENTRVYVGCDSERVNKKGKWYADFCTVVVVHKGGNNGCKIFGKVERERDYDQKAGKPRLRLMMEVQKVAAFYIEYFDMLWEFDPEIHLDINPNLDYGSSCVIQEATGYIVGMCQVEPKTKPEAFSASYAADRFAHMKANTTKKNERRKRHKDKRKDNRQKKSAKK